MNSMRRRPSLHRINNPPNPWHSLAVEWIEEVPKVALEIYEDRSRQILSHNDSPDLGFSWSVNPYRGCYHGCAYCYARPTHHYLDFGAGTDFERRLTVKPEAPDLLDAALRSARWQGELIAFSGNTDCYQPLEASWGLTRACLEVCLRYHQPVSIVTKSTLVERDLELLAELARHHCTVNISIPIDDPDHARALEPYVPRPARRYETIRKLSDAGVPVGVLVAPVIPGLSDADIPAILEQARDAGATFAGHSMIRLPGAVSAVFEARLREALPDRADRVMHQIAACRSGAQDDRRFGHRMRGVGARWDAIASLFHTTRDRLGFAPAPEVPEPSPYRPPEADQQQLRLAL